MTSLNINPLVFNNSNSEVKLSNKTIEWKKQIATLSKKKDLSAIEFLNTKYGSKVKQLLEKVGPKAELKSAFEKDAKLNKSQNDAVVFAYFDYENDSTIYLMYISNDEKSNDKSNIIELNFDTYIPSLNNIEIVDGSYNIECLEDKIIVKGYVYGFCLSNETYYFNKINIDQYIEYVQRNNVNNDDDDEQDLEFKDEDDEDDEDDDDDDRTDNNDTESDNDEDDEVDEVDDIDDEVDDNDIEDDDEDEEDEVDEVDEEIIKNDGDDIIEEQNNGNEEDNAEDNAEDNIEDNIAENIDDTDFEIKKKVRQKKIKTLKCQLPTNIEDFNIILNVLKLESNTIFIPETELHIKRQINIKILEKLKLPKKTIQLIEKGIYNYSIEKCKIKDIIPIWDNPCFLEIYLSKSKNLYSNLNTKTYVNNVKLIEKIKNGTILPYDLAFIDTHKLFPERWADIIDEKTKVDKMLNESLQECATDLFECPRCNKNKTIYLQVQIRSSDEPMTNFITCMNCGNKWQTE